LEACKEMLKDILDHSQFGLNDREVQMVQKANAAISKADGI